MVDPAPLLTTGLMRSRGWLMTSQDLIVKVAKILPARGPADGIPISRLYKINFYCKRNLTEGVRDYR